MRKAKWFSRRDHFIKIAKRVFFKDGLVSANMEDIASEAGSSRTALYYYFESKKEIIEGVLEKGFDLYREEVLKKIESVNSREDALSVLFNTFMLLAEKDKEFVTVYLRLSLKDNEKLISPIEKDFSSIETENFKMLLKNFKNKNLNLSIEQLTDFFKYLKGALITYLLGNGKVDKLCKRYIELL